MKINDFNSELKLTKESDIRSEERKASVTKKPIPESARLRSHRSE